MSATVVVASASAPIAVRGKKKVAKVLATSAPASASAMAIAPNVSRLRDATVEGIRPTDTAVEGIRLTDTAVEGIRLTDGITVPMSVWMNARQRRSAIEAVFQSAAWGQLDRDPVTEGDRKNAAEVGALLTFGELMSEGVSKALDGAHLNASNARKLVDAGAGQFKLVLQAFLEYDTLDEVVGIELCESRFKKAVKLIRTFCHRNSHVLMMGVGNETEKDDVSVTFRMPGSTKTRVLRMIHADLFSPQLSSVYENADIVLFEVELSEKRRSDLLGILQRLKRGARILMYHCLSAICGVKELPRAQTKGDTSRLVDVSKSAPLIKDVISGKTPMIPNTNAPRPPANLSVIYREIAPGDTLPASWCKEPAGRHFSLWVHVATNAN
jgi:hypothetical protein